MFDFDKLLHILHCIVCHDSKVQSIFICLKKLFYAFAVLVVWLVFMRITHLLSIKYHAGIYM